MQREKRAKKQQPKIRVEIHPLTEIGKMLSGVELLQQPTPQEIERRAHQHRIDSRNAKLVQLAECMLHILVSTAPMSDRRVEGASIAKAAFDIAAGFMAEAEKRMIQPNDAQAIVDQCQKVEPQS